MFTDEKVVVPSVSYWKYFTRSFVVVITYPPYIKILFKICGAVYRNQWREYVAIMDKFIKSMLSILCNFWSVNVASSFTTNG
jgi:hypothetical protein